ncbi:MULTISPECIES: NB-ARC domain-containing protein [unclassified Roseofilum]|uniref:beta-propeller domain-containing protein n=1 Tax=unclassified Roseofilum TaxID=2620099 RepID=UPI001B0149E4|nr:MULTISPECIES: NB-ARC domain-containing protein [unclassified Roseofilum]MBP0008282.1 hypothetical protein [Roseofilum sp. Belize Diploria]MBP0032747.1 hypothetical protein [Roseofilum sp. Belize BBD 4]
MKSTGIIQFTEQLVNTFQKLPPHFLPRPQEMQELKQLLWSSRILVVQGKGGMGKTVLAIAIAQDEEVRRKFVDGVVCLPVGIATKPIELYQQLAQALEGSKIYQETEVQWKAHLSKLLQDKSCLLILDEVKQQPEVERWHKLLGKNCQILLTTRESHLVDGLGAKGYLVEKWDDDPSLQLLAKWANVDKEQLPEEASAIVQECRQLPLALALAGGQVGDGTLWKSVLRALQDQDEEGFDPADTTATIQKCIAVSLQNLEQEKQDAYLELGIFPPHTKISEAALVKLWGRKGHKEESQLQQQLTQLEKRALVFAEGESPHRWVWLHDMQQNYLQEKLQDKAKVHREFLASYAKGRFPWKGAQVEGETYLYQHAAYHFQKAEEEEAFAQLLGDFDWLWPKLEATDIQALLLDFDRVQDKDRFLRRLQKALRLSAQVLTQDKQQFASQLWGRLLNLKQMKKHEYQYFWQKIPILGRYLPHHRGRGKVEQLLQQAKDRQTHTWFRPLAPCLDSSDGALLCTLRGHQSWVNTVAVTRDGQLAVSGSSDKTLKVWDLETKEETLTLTGHRSLIQAVAVTRDGQRAVSGSSDKTLKVWDLETGEALLTLMGHDSMVKAVAVTPDGQRAVSGSSDNTLKVWDLKTGNKLLTLTGHSGSVQAVAVTPDGQRAVSGSMDKMLKVWDLKTGEQRLTLKGHDHWVNAVAVTPDGRRVVSSSMDKTLKVWDLKTGEEELTLTDHQDWVQALAVTPDGKQAVSAADNNTLQVWDLATGEEKLTLRGHRDSIQAVAVTLDGQQAVSAAMDNTLKVWNLETGEELHTLTDDGGYQDWVRALAVTQDRQIAVFATIDNALKIWDLKREQERYTLTGHQDSVQAIAVTSDGKRAVSSSMDKTLKVWNLEMGEELHTLTGHHHSIPAVAITPDGRRAVSASMDSTLKVWDLATGEELRTLTGHSHWIQAVAVTPDGQCAVSVLDRTTLKVWDLVTGEERLTVTVHQDWVRAVAVTSDGRRVVSGSVDKTLKVWDLATGEVLGTFVAEAAILRCAIAPDGCTVVAGDRVGRVYQLLINNSL